MEAAAHSSVEESEMIMQLLGPHYFQDFNADSHPCYSSSQYNSNNWPQKDITIDLNYETTNQENVNNHKRKCEIENQDYQNSCATIYPKKKARNCSTTNACKENEEDLSGSSLSENESIDKSRVSNSKVKSGNQSLYARKRREKINQRLRKLQELVPNGTKVDISTMLTDAYQYIQFLQLQIKLLSSDETWMYAPLAFNGISTEFDMNMYQD